MVLQYNEEFTGLIIDETRKRFEQIIPELPNIGGSRNIMTAIIIINGWFISFLKVMKVHGKTTEDVRLDAGEIIGNGWII